MRVAKEWVSEKRKKRVVKTPLKRVPVAFMTNCRDASRGRERVTSDADPCAANVGEMDLSHRRKKVVTGEVSPERGEGDEARNGKSDILPRNLPKLRLKKTLEERPEDLMERQEIVKTDHVCVDIRPNVRIVLICVPGANACWSYPSEFHPRRFIHCRKCARYQSMHAQQAIYERGNPKAIYKMCLSIKRRAFSRKISWWSSQASLYSTSVVWFMRVSDKSSYGNAKRNERGTTNIHQFMPSCSVILGVPVSYDSVRTRPFSNGTVCEAKPSHHKTCPELSRIMHMCLQCSISPMPTNPGSV
ncbi:hypothetical protein DFJ77DRAFT_464918 [Powellomyces hirtus]|nr:hypothetical protein DFJ77DRAFT_464918 [Powellomyces hirtus]